MQLCKKRLFQKDVLQTYTVIDRRFGALKRGQRENNELLPSTIQQPGDD